MPSPPPLQPSVFYHIYNRGINRENVFVEERNYRHFMQLYAKHIGPVAETYAYCQLKNHFHLLVRIKDDVPTKDGDLKVRFAKTFRVWERNRLSGILQFL